MGDTPSNLLVSTAPSKKPTLPPSLTGCQSLKNYQYRGSLWYDCQYCFSPVLCPDASVVKDRSSEKNVTCLFILLAGGWHLPTSHNILDGELRGQLSPCGGAGGLCCHGVKSASQIHPSRLWHWGGGTSIRGFVMPWRQSMVCLSNGARTTCLRGPERRHVLR